MKYTIKFFIIPMLLVSSACHAAIKSASTNHDASAGHYTEYTCTFGKYGSVTTHVGGIRKTYITVGKKPTLHMVERISCRAMTTTTS